ncbi:MAG TPA: FUN14 domain-containing protein [Candidatus Babeliales bacterium]|nr:FUN14 domain-containing protein [Candidatus Babeliales bacterium]
MDKSTAAATATEKVTTWADKFKSYANLDGLSQRFNISSQQFIEVVTYLGIAFFVGFIFKKYSRSIIIGAFAIVIALVCLEAFEIITIDWVQLRQITGVHPQDTVSGLVSMWVELARAHVMLVVSMVVGFFIGYKVG